jgi:SHS2 domain-containing protein
MLPEVVTVQTHLSDDSIPDDVPVPGVTAIDHTADVGFDVEAVDFPELVRCAVLGMDWLLREAASPTDNEQRDLEVVASSPPDLLRAALREILVWYEVSGFAPADVDVVAASDTHMKARVHGGVPAGAPVREIKGVTLHELTAEPRGDGWWGRVVFDV